jgi:hypothetical protein
MCSLIALLIIHKYRFAKTSLVFWVTIGNSAEKSFFERINKIVPIILPAAPSESIPQTLLVNQTCNCSKRDIPSMFKANALNMGQIGALWPKASEYLSQ